MGILDKLFGGDQQDQQPARGEDYEQFMEGFRLGYPLIGDPPIEESDNPHFQRGLAAGRTSFEADGRPQIKRDDA
jgi:hypothetical protein